MILLALMLATTSPPLSLRPFDDEEAAARAFDAALGCLGNAAFEHRTDQREIPLVANDVIETCKSNSDGLRAALTDVYSRKPDLRPTGKTASEAAELYVTEMNDRIEPMLREGREHR